MAQEGIKWYTTVEVIDIETGEILNKKAVESGRYLIKEREITKQVKEVLSRGWHGIAQKKGYINIKWLCIANPQITIEL